MKELVNLWDAVLNWGDDYPIFSSILIAVAVLVALIAGFVLSWQLMILLIIAGFVIWAVTAIVMTIRGY